MSHELPECWCADWDACDWRLEIGYKYHRPSNPDATNEELKWTLSGVPQPLAKAIATVQIDLVNRSAVDIYTAMLEACGGDGAQAAAATVRKLVNGG